jgi:phosphate transport system permease protein
MRRQTHPRVRAIDHAMKVFITIGGIAIIGAVLAIFLFLLLNVLPLFKSGSAELSKRGILQLAGEPVSAMVDSHRGLMLVLMGDGRVQGHKLDDLSPLTVTNVVPEGRRLTAFSEPNESGQVGIGLDDGSVMVGEIGFGEPTFLLPEQIETDAARRAKVETLEPGERIAVDGGGYVERTPIGQLRVTKPAVRFGAAVALADGAGEVVRVDYRGGAARQVLLTQRADGTVAFSQVNVVRPLGGGTPRTRLRSTPVAWQPPATVNKVADYLFTTADGSNIFALWRDGTIQRYAPTGEGELRPFALQETQDLLTGDAKVTAARLHLGGRSLLIGTSDGRLMAGFAAQTSTTKTPDGWAFAIGNEATLLPGEAVTSLATATRERSVLVAGSGGGFAVYHTTSGKEVLPRDVAKLEGLTLGVGGKVAVIAPKTDGLFLLGSKGELLHAEFEPRHSEVSMQSIFGKIWYEGDEAPKYTYQASTGEDTAETKYSLVPLMFGTLKATVYALLFAVPIALMAAIYTSEFLHPKVKNTVKPAIEMMASLPSVVLGFVAAFFIAPLFRDYLPGVLMAFFVIPVAVLMAGYAWQIMPVRITTRLTSLQHLGVMLVIVLASITASVGLGRTMERVLFAPSENDLLVLAGSTMDVPREQWPESVRDKRVFTANDIRPYRGQGLYYSDGKVVRATGSLDDPKVKEAIAKGDFDRVDMRQWLNGIIGQATPGWILVMTAPAIIIVALIRGRLVDAWLSSLPGARFGAKAAVIEVLKFAVTLGLGIAVAIVLAQLLTGMGLDARDTVLGTYTQRNTLVVGMVMGFAIIPIIYTISEDSLSAVPGPLRSASLGCGATRWQTATRVVLPIAMSGIFSACMIGLGRAAGETMIVLMATGNTPTMEWNIFEGMRTLSANIAVEMPEAAKGSTHERMLYLGGLCLFAMTFVVNTFAEVVRQRVRKRSAGL